LKKTASTYTYFELISELRTGRKHVQPFTRSTEKLSWDPARSPQDSSCKTPTLPCEGWDDQCGAAACLGTGHRASPRTTLVVQLLRTEGISTQQPVVTTPGMQESPCDTTVRVVTTDAEHIPEHFDVWADQLGHLHNGGTCTGPDQWLA